MPMHCAEESAVIRPSGRARGGPSDAMWPSGADAQAGWMSLYAPIKGKCTWWREFPNEEDRFNSSLSERERRVECVCFVEGDAWEYKLKDLPADCPFFRRCRYHVRAG